jgi:hypothetical protein
VDWFAVVRKTVSSEPRVQRRRLRRRLRLPAGRGVRCQAADAVELAGGCMAGGMWRTYGTSNSTTAPLLCVDKQQVRLAFTDSLNINNHVEGALPACQGRVPRARSVVPTPCSTPQITLSTSAARTRANVRYNFTAPVLLRQSNKHNYICSNDQMQALTLLDVAYPSTCSPLHRLDDLLMRKPRASVCMIGDSFMWQFFGALESRLQVLGHISHRRVTSHFRNGRYGLQPSSTELWTEYGLKV